LPGIEASVFSSLQSRTVTGALFLNFINSFPSSGMYRIVRPHYSSPRPPPPFLSLFNLSLSFSLFLSLSNIHSRRNFFLKKRQFFRFSFHLIFPRLSPFTFFFNIVPYFFRYCSTAHFLSTDMFPFLQQRNSLIRVFFLFFVPYILIISFPFKCYHPHLIISDFLNFSVGFN